jgi:drug/metabolite transporter (DMT)-like permease
MAGSGYPGDAAALLACSEHVAALRVSCLARACQGRPAGAGPVSPTAIVLILIAALAHATWNLFSKQASATGAVSFIWLVSACATAMYAPVIAVWTVLERPQLSGMSWLFMVGTGVLQTGYFLFLQTGYRLGDLSLVYPIGRGTGALLAALAGILLLGEHPGAAGIAGIGCIVAGIVLIGLPGRAADRPQPAAAAAPGWQAIVFALVTGAFIASYTVWDKHAVSALHTPALLQGYAAFPVMLAALTPAVLRDRQRLRSVWRSFRPQAIGAGLLAPFAYILVLAALSFTAVSAVAPAREVSVLFGVLLGGRLLKEGSLPRRLAAAAAIVAGIVAIAIS